jgi:hypothetical protein
MQRLLMENGGEVRMTTLDSVCNTCHRQLIDHELTVADRPIPVSRDRPLYGDESIIERPVAQSICF